MGLNPIVASKNIVNKYLRYIETTFYINDEDYMKQFKKHLSKVNNFSKGPYLEFSDSFESGKSIEQLIDEGILSSEFKKLYKNQKNLLSRPLYKHQEISIRKIMEDRNLVITTGTGSGKTESFLIPVINYLMRQKEAGELSDGVRALIIYPMNALANDQMKRMRQLLADYPDITFGSYTGETENTDEKALSKYMSLNNGQVPLPNERISRNQMKKNPPHILITNYAMLEYLLLRPEDNVFFHGNNAQNWKYIIFDEAHTYTGATGIEVSMLLRRLKHTLKNKERIRFILTSATLGDEKNNKEICEFASRFCADSKFDDQSIVRAFRYSFKKPDSISRLPIKIYSDLFYLLEEKAPMKKFIELINTYDIDFTCNCENISELLYDLISKDGLYYEVREILQNQPATIKNISEKLQINEEDLVNFVNVACQAEKKNVMLLDARYHMFIRSLEGVYITLGKKKDLSIMPREKVFINGDEYKSYKISVCKYCGQIYIGAVIDENNYLIQKKENEYNGKNNYYMLINDSILNKEEDDDDFVDDENYQVYDLCGKCGKIVNSNAVNGEMCGCGNEHIVKVKEIKPKEKILNRCLACGLNSRQSSILRGFYLGEEAAASVIGSSLYEEIPSEEKIRDIEPPLNFDDDFFGGEVIESLPEYTINNKVNKQLLVFSDSRQEAAYFASYFDFTYNNMLRKRLFIEALKEIGEFASDDGIEINAAVKKLAALLEKHNIVEPENAIKEAWKTILYEISSNDRNSLENLGLISFEYQGIKIPIMGIYQGKDVLTIQRVLANSFKKDCMFDFPLANEMLKSDREYYSYKGTQCSMTLLNFDSKNKYCKSWLPKTHSNSRYNYVFKTTGKEKKEINEFLRKMWESVYLSRGNQGGGLIAQRPNEYVMDISKFKIRTSFTHNIEWYICDKCGRVTVNNINNVCPKNRCDGKLRLCDFDKDFANNHYRKQYLELDIFPMKIKEHTAQLSPERAKKYQEQFIKNEINVLSCSTTFEMGVDVGELETVFMKNMPPTPANYTQRAGRVGRRKNSVAYSLTFCRLSSHDLKYFNTPVKMIKGKIQPPRFKIANEKIVKRHMNAAIIAAFWKRNKEYYKDVGTFFNDDAYEKLILFIENLPNEIRQYINEFVPNVFKEKINDWILELKSDKGCLNKQYRQYKAELNELLKLREEEINKAAAGEKIGPFLNKIDKYIDKIKKENILTYLSKKNIIPKYGFPVDTVELVTSFDDVAINTNYAKSQNLRLQRDLMIAISEYAPGSEVIADGNIYKSQYIKRPTGKNKVWDLYDFGVCSNPKCGHLNIERHIDEKNSKFPKPCEICGEYVEKNNTFIIPEYGFIISPQISKATTKKPEKTYSGEIFYVGDKDEIIEKVLKEHEINNHLIQIRSTSNDELVVVNTSNFYVCETCGYSKVAEKFKKENFIIEKNEHKNPYGKQCANKKLYRRTLGHKFKTDVAYISVGRYIERDKALSILYALLEGVSQYLGIERNDISGTLHYNKLNTGNWETNFILFDTVPGGAGHVRRIGEADKTQFINMLQKSLDIVKQCNCGEDSNGDSACYSCLCNYYNQNHHDIIKRRYAIEFFEDILF